MSKYNFYKQNMIVMFVGGKNTLVGWIKGPVGIFSIFLNGQQVDSQACLKTCYSFYCCVSAVYIALIHRIVLSSQDNSDNFLCPLFF